MSQQHDRKRGLWRSLCLALAACPVALGAAVAQAAPLISQPIAAEVHWQGGLSLMQPVYQSCYPRRDDRIEARDFYSRCRPCRSCLEFTAPHRDGRDLRARFEERDFEREEPSPPQRGRRGSRRDDRGDAWQDGRENDRQHDWLDERAGGRREPGAGKRKRKRRAWIYRGCGPRCWIKRAKQGYCGHGCDYYLER